MTKFQFESARQKQPVRAFLVTVTIGRNLPFDQGEELTELVSSNGMQRVGLMSARRDKPDAATYLGSGKIEELREMAQAAQADVIVFDADLSAAQERNIADQTECAVIDRTELIIDIFRKRARSNEGKLQVELARLEHLATRLVRGWTHLERQRGGLGKTGGPGEKQIELDRRMIAERIKRLKAELKKLQRRRDVQRHSRGRSETVSVSLVGYTNAGKSTLFNRLTREKIYVANQLFATLDTTARRCWLTDEETVVLSDTVGFIRALPHQLVDAFRSTLDETVHADILLHVVDSGSAVKAEQMDAVRQVLEEIRAEPAATLIVYNKIDASGMEPVVQTDPETGIVRSVAVSALTGDGIDQLRGILADLSADIRLRKQSLPREAEDWEVQFEQDDFPSDEGSGRC